MIRHERPCKPAITSCKRIALAMACWVCFVPGCNDVDERPAEWAFIAPVIIAPNCATASCHSAQAAAAGLDLSEPGKAYESLLAQEAQYLDPGAVGVAPAVCRAERGGILCPTTRPLVAPCRPDESRLVNTLFARGTQQMPPDRPLPLADIELIERWILAGAKRSPQDLLPRCGEPLAPGADAGAPDAAAPAANMDAASASDADVGGANDGGGVG